MSYLITNSATLTALANAIRSKAGTSGGMVWPDDFLSVIQGMEDSTDGTATSGDILSGKTAYVNRGKITGTIPSKAAETYNASDQDRTIQAGRYLSGAQVIKGIQTSGISAGNIKAGTTVKVGDSDDDDRIAGITGTFTGDANAAAGDMLSGKTAYVNGAKVTGNIPSKAAATYNTSGTDQTVAASQYLSGAQTIKAVTTENISAGNIKAGVVARVGDENNAGRIKNITGTFTGDGTAVAGDMLSGKIAYVNGSKITGTIASKAATTYNTSTSDQTIAAGQYLSGAQTIRKVTTSGISAANIKAGVTVKVGDAGDDDRITGVTGTYKSTPTLQTSTTVTTFAQREIGGSGYYSASFTVTAPSALSIPHYARVGYGGSEWYNNEIVFIKSNNTSNTTWVLEVHGDNGGSSRYFLVDRIAVSWQTAAVTV